MQREGGLQPQGSAHDIRGDEGIAVAVAADPASHLQERRQFARGLVADVQPVFQRADQPRHLAQEGVVIKFQSIFDLVEHGELGPAQQIGLPQGQHLAAQLLVALLSLLRRELDALAPVEQARDLHLAVHRALAADLGRMRGEDGTDEGVLEKAPQIGRRDAGGLRMRQRLGQGPCPRPTIGDLARTHLADVVVVLGDIGQVREIGEGAHDAHPLGDRQAVEHGFEFPPREPVFVAVESDRGLPDTLDHVEYVGALLVAHRIAENTPEQPDIVAQPCVFLQRLRVVGAVGPKVGVGRHGLGGHGSSLQKLPGNLAVCNFFAAAQDEERGAVASEKTSSSEVAIGCASTERPRPHGLPAMGSIVETHEAARLVVRNLPTRLS